MFYDCYQLLIDSEIELPELHAANPPAGVAADVTIRIGHLSQDGSACGERRGPYLYMREDAMWLHVPGIARYQVEAGARIVVSPEAGIDVDSVRLFLLGSAFGAMLAQRGRMVVHGNALRLGDGCLICVGPSGAGKSTLAAALMQRGHEVLADDVVAIDEEGRALPGLPRIKLWKDAAEHLQVATGGLARIRPALEKFNLPLADSGAVPPIPVRWIYVLSSHREDSVKIVPTRGLERFKLIQENLYRARILSAMSPKPEHLALSGRLASQARIARVSRPERGFALGALVDALLADAAAHA